MTRAPGVLASAALVAACSANPDDSNAHVIRPMCDSPAPLRGTYNSQAPGYIVQLRAGTSVAAEVQRLSAVHALAETRLMESSGMFFAVMSPATVAALRCDSSVQAIEHDGVATIAR
jgi:hypothetical protein